jgi:septum site-determining protein MinC
MSVPKSQRSASASHFEIRASSINLPSLKLMGSDIDAIVDSLQEKVQQAPEFFRDAPILIDLHDLSHECLDFIELNKSLRAVGLVPVGIRGGDAAMQESAIKAHLAVFSDVRHDVQTGATQHGKATETKPNSVNIGFAEARIIHQPVRSGQRIYAGGGDLIVLAPVSAGAEIMADGNIHVYGVLRGRALAGVQGNSACRIFCSDLQAELVSVAGHYKVSESLNDSVRNRPVQIYLNNNSLIIEDL